MSNEDHSEIDELEYGRLPCIEANSRVKLKLKKTLEIKYLLAFVQEDARGCLSTPLASRGCGRPPFSLRRGREQHPLHPSFKH